MAVHPSQFNHTETQDLGELKEQASLEQLAGRLEAEAANRDRNKKHNEEYLERAAECIDLANLAEENIVTLRAEMLRRLSEPT